MKSREYLLFMLRTNRDVVKKLVDDITEEESMARGHDGHNHLRWQMGHLLYSKGYTLANLGDQSVDHSSLKSMCAEGAEVSDDPSVYPLMSDLRTRLYNAHDRLIVTIENASNDQLDRKLGDKDDWLVWQQLIWSIMHDFYHLGQIAQVRRMLGRDRPFG